MSKYFVESQDLTDIADAIREGLASTESLEFPDDFISKIGDLGGGGITPTGTKQINVTANGTTATDVTAYATAEVIANVPASAVDTGTKNIATNGTHDVIGYASASVAVPASAVDTGTKNIATNGTHDVIGYASASVAVPASAVDSGTKSITSNGTGQDVVGYASVDVNVPNTYSASDESKVVYNGELVSQASASTNVNGTYDTTLIGSFTVDVSGGGSSALYPLENGEFTFNNGAKVTVTSGHHVVITIPSGNTSDGFIDLSDISENSTTFNTSGNVQNHSSKFTISNGQRADYMIVGLSSAGGCSFNVYGTGTSNLGMSISNLNNTFGEATKTFTANSDVGCLFFVGRTPGTYTFDVRFIVNGIDYV